MYVYVHYGIYVYMHRYTCYGFIYVLWVYTCFHISISIYMLYFFCVCVCVSMCCAWENEVCECKSSISFQKRNPSPCSPTGPSVIFVSFADTFLFLKLSSRSQPVICKKWIHSVSRQWSEAVCCSVFLRDKYCTWHQQLQ